MITLRFTNYNTNKIRVLCTNVTSLTSGVKRDELQIVIDRENIDIVGITETWGRSDILVGEMEILGFYRAMLCIRGTSHGPVSVRLSVCPSQVGVLLKRLNVGSHKQHHTIAQGL